MEQIVNQLLQRRQLPVAQRTFTERVRAHPDYPSLMSIADALASLGVENYVSQVEDEDLKEVPFPYLAHLSRAETELVLIDNAADLAAARSNPDHWTGVLMQVAGMRTAPSAEQAKTYEQERKLTLITRLAVGALLLLLVQPALHFGSLAATGLYLVALVGAFIGYLLFMRDLGIAPPMVAEFCGSGPQAGCDDILDTEPIKLFGFFNLSDAVATYFPWQVALLAGVALAPAQTAELLPLLVVAALLGLFMVGFSVYYQALVAKAWCRLCLVVDAILLVQAIGAIYLIAQPQFSFMSITFAAVANACGLLLLLGGGVVLAKQFGLRYHQDAAAMRGLQRVKNSSAHFAKLLLQQPRADTSAFAQEMMFGNPAADIEVIMVSNPYCMPCKHAHMQLERLLALYPDNLKARMRLTVSGADTGRFPTTTQYLLQHWLTHVWQQPNASERTATMLHEWYESMSLEQFAASHPADFTGDYSLSTALGTQHYLWNRHQQITHTPTFFINGYKMPDGYSLADLTMIVPGLADFFQQDDSLVPVGEGELVQ